jgi:hypothetical protein
MSRFVVDLEKSMPTSRISRRHLAGNAVMKIDAGTVDGPQELRRVAAPSSDPMTGEVPMTCNPATDRTADVKQTLLQALLLHYLELVDPHLWPGVDGLTIDAVLKGYAQAVAAGQAPGAVELLLRHPELAAEVDEFFHSSGPCKSYSSRM